MGKLPRYTHFAFKIPLIYVHSVVFCLLFIPHNFLFHFISCSYFMYSVSFFFFSSFIHKATDRITEIFEIVSEPLQSAAHKYIYCSDKIPWWNKTFATHFQTDELKWNENKQQKKYLFRWKVQFLTGDTISNDYDVKINVSLKSTLRWRFIHLHLECLLIRCQ